MKRRRAVLHVEGTRPVGRSDDETQVYFMREQACIINLVTPKKPVSPGIKPMDQIAKPALHYS